MPDLNESCSRPSPRMERRGRFAAGSLHRRIAFTLLELLVVIGIIAVLLGVLVPALSGARKSARGVDCQSRLRLQGQAMMTYEEAYDAIPLAESDSMHFAAALLPGLGYWNINIVGSLYNNMAEDAFMKIIGDEEAFQCPDYPKIEQRLDFVVNGFERPYTNPDDGGPPGDSPTPQGLDDRTVFASLTRLSQSPSGVIYVTEAHEALPTDSFQMHDLFRASQLPFGTYPRIPSERRHPGGVNALYFDTHVDVMKPEVVDVGSPNPVGLRLRYFTTVP
ncbi:MAG: type II secretion system protein [Planctomycetota bacterium]